MIVSQKSWLNFIQKLGALDDKAAKLIVDYMSEHSVLDDDDKRTFLDYAYAVATKYGEASSSLACDVYDMMAEAQNAHVPPAVPAPTPTYSEVARTVNGASMHSQNPDYIGGAVGSLVKRTGVDTTLNNALRDGAEWAWIPHGDTCPFCLMLASNGWQRASKKALRNGHANHIHANCDCTYAIRFDGESTIEGYDPEALYDQYKSAEGRSGTDKINYLRRKNYAANKDAINAQKREAYAFRNGAVAEAGHKGKNRSTEIKRSIIESPDYGRRLSSIDNNRDVSNTIIKEARKMLKHRSGTEYEDLMFIDIRSGEYITRTDYNVPRRVLASRRMKSMVKTSPEYTIASVHNHPGSTMPSPGDIHSLNVRKNAYGVVLCHDGSIYKYKTSNNNLNEAAYSSALDKLEREGYTESAMKKFLQAAKDAGIYIEVL